MAVAGETVDYINESWRHFLSPRAILRALGDEGDSQ